jgi:hypothetical protein
MRTPVKWLAVVAVLSAGCASTQISTTWRNPAYADRAPRKVLVAAEIPTAAARHQLEQQLSQQLREKGVAAVPFTTFDTSGGKPDSAAIEKAARAGGFDGVVMSRMIGVTQHYSYSPGGYGGYGWYGYGYGYGLGYVDLVEAAHIETNLYSLRQARPELVWSGSSSTVSSGANGTALSRRDIDHYTKVIATRLTRDVLG